MLKKIKEIWSKTDDVFKSYPLVLLMAFSASICAITLAEINRDFDSQNDTYFPIIKVIITSLLGISLLFAMKMISQRIGKEFLLNIVGVLLLFGFYFLLPEHNKDFSEVQVFYIIPIFILSHLLVSFGAFLGKESENHFWQYNKNLFINLFLTAVFTGVLTGGVLLAILAVDKLFDLEFYDVRYQQTFFFLSIFGSCFIFLLFNEKGLKFIEKQGTYPQILKFFTQFVLIPLLFIYLVILYFYSFKILINWELPRGWVSYLILAYSVVGILALLLVYPLKETSTKSWVKMFSKIFYFSLIPLLVLLFVAIKTRILEYGFTEPRYYVLLIALWLTSLVVYFTFTKNPSIKYIPISLFLFGTFALIFPYFNAFSVTKRSQRVELNKLLNQNKLLTNGKINFKQKIDSETLTQMSDEFVFLAKRKDSAFLLSYLDQPKKIIIEKELKIHNYWGINNHLYQFFNQNNLVTADISMRLWNKSKLTTIKGYEYLLTGSNLINNEIKIHDDSFTMHQNKYNQDFELSLILNNKERLELAPFIMDEFKKYSGENETIKVNDLSTEGDLGNYHVKIIFEEINKNFSGKTDYNFNNATVLIREK